MIVTTHQVRQAHAKPIQPMKFILLALTGIALLPVTGCVFPGNRDHSDDRNHPGGDHPAGVDHGEYPGDMDHQPER